MSIGVVPLVDEGLGNSAYLVDLGDGQGLVIDPERDPTPYLTAAETRGLQLRFVMETHLHADFVSGGRELAARGARLMAPAESKLLFDHVGLSDGDEVDLGGLTMRVIATPGHTPEHCSYLLMDGSNPLALFAGGTLIAGGMARTDLITADLTEELARAAYRSIRDRLLTLPDALPVYPTHGAGSFCATSPTGERITTIGRERIANPLLQAEDEDDFVTRLLAGYGSYPPYFRRLREVNRAGPRVYGTWPIALRTLGANEVERMMDSGETDVLDIRSIRGFAAGHIPGSLSIHLRDQFATWLGWLVDPGQALVFVADPDQDLAGAVSQSLNIGYEHLGGYLGGGISAWQQSGRSLTTTRLLGPEQIPPQPAIVDVRQASEWELGHVASAAHIELGEIAGRARDLPSDVVLHCGHGHRAMSAASLLERAGRSDVAVTTASAGQLTRVLASSTR